MGSEMCIRDSLMLEGDKTNADVVIGLNTDVTKKARGTGLFAPHGQNNGDLDLPIAWQDDVFLPFNWSYVSFVYDDTRLTTEPRSFEDLVTLPNGTNNPLPHHHKPPSPKAPRQAQKSNCVGLGSRFWTLQAG